MGGEQDLNGHLTIESALLEMAYAALEFSRGKKIIPRYETLGVFHDLLEVEDDGYVITECIGSLKISPKKIRLFKNQIDTLNSRLRESGDNGIKGARIVAMLDFQLFPEETKHELGDLKNHLESSGITLDVVSPKKLVYDLFSTSVMGFRLVDNHIFLVGPGEVAVRFNPAISKFCLTDSMIDIQGFRKLPHSFIPRYYWLGSSKRLFEEYSDFSEEEIPSWFSWSSTESAGITWRSVEQMKDAIINSFITGNRELVFEKSNGFITKRKLLRNPYYTANLIYHKQIIDGDDATRITSEMHQLIETAKKEGKIDEDLAFFNRIFTDTITFSHKYWNKAHYFSSSGKVSYTEIKRGEDVLIDALNAGSLGIKLDAGRIVLSLEDSPNVLKIVGGALHWESEGREVYPARVEF